MHAQHAVRTKKHQEKFGSSTRPDRQNQQAKDALEALFIPTEDPKAKKDWDLLAQESGQAWQTKANELIAQHGYPIDPEHCVSLLDLEDVMALKGLLTSVTHQWPEYSASNRETLQQKARVAAMMALDDDMVNVLEAFCSLDS